MAKGTRTTKKAEDSDKTSFSLEVGSKIREVKLEKKLETKDKSNQIIKAKLVGDKVVSSDKNARDLQGKSRFGEIIEGKISYPLTEALYLLEKGRLTITNKGKKLSFDKFLEIVRESDPNFYTKFCVFRDMRNRGYIVKTALKFGADFRVYDRGIKPGEDHAKWVLFPVHESSILTWHDFAAKNRVAHSTKKKLLIGIVDEEGDVTYYICEWTRP
ncbi:MAG: tRNA-intron lyase [Candidatus Pacearchaeota archaeon]|nr:tRNA-intron lyase [Candidatus Pacearchaeota archaeon]